MKPDALSPLGLPNRPGLKRAKVYTPAAAVVLLCVAVALSLSAQTVTQTFQLQNGWNAIYLEVMPTNGSPTNLFAGITSR